MNKLTLKQKRFVEEYIISGNAYQSAIIAGYSEKYAKSDSHKLLENTGIKTALDERLSELESKKIAKQEEILQFLTSVMRGEQTEQTLIGMGEGAQGVTDIEVSAKDRIKAAELLGKRHQLWTDKVDITKRSIQITIGDWDDGA